MRNIITAALLIVFLSMTMGSCKKKAANRNTAMIEKIVEDINADSNKELPNVTILTKCEYQKGDSLMTYHIKVEDGRFDNISSDSIKASLIADLHTEKTEKLVKILKKNAIGLQYIFNTSTKDITIVISPKDF